MKFIYVVIIAVPIIALRVWMFRRRRAGAGAGAVDPGAADPGAASGRTASGRGVLMRASDRHLSDVALVALREIKERVRGRIFRVGTLVVLAVVAAAIIIPTINKGSSSNLQTAGIVGSLSAQSSQLLHEAATVAGDSLKLVTEPSITAADDDLRSGRVDVAIIDSNAILLDQPATASSSPADATFVSTAAEYLGVLAAYRKAGLTAAQAKLVTDSKPVPVHYLQPGSKTPTNSTSAIGLVLLFVMLTQYNTWILIGVMQEKSSRVVEVLLATVRPLQLLGGKVLGIGLVALGQATVVAGFALILGSAVGSDLLHGSAPLVLGCQLLWLVLGYAFYCWVYAAAGSTAERQDQVQTMALPLSIPILIGYIFSLTTAASGQVSTFFRVLAFLPPTAPFCMPVLVGLSATTWWQFLLSALISVAGTAGMAVVAARIYRRAVLQTGGRVRFRQLLARPAR